ncbi:hypothetical protein [Anaerocolumna sp. MB42-C2]|uniref:hypothetical protein n=1 Tax=Anaerocolumna sp. MB42-C2 TaxID=3070997 RepID=UPI0027DEC106|nr:hypothetical protein [Anaerocolumna sp. MB42-C2]WMJ85498.1 hypothetical protein RBU59_15615 [Anaerocolumna sp. MB42-C2]
MVQELFDKNIFSYIMLALCACGILLKLVLNLVYSRLIKASDNMAKSKNKLTQMMKKKFETCYKLKIGVNNVDIFVDKYVFRHRFCGILLSTWENIGGQILMLCILIGSISTIVGLIYECGKQQILSTFSVGILTSGLLIFLEGLINLSGRKELIRLNMKDYLENILKVRLEQEQVTPELIEQYKKEYLHEEEQALNSAELLAAASEKAGKLTRKEKKDKLLRLKAEKRKEKQQRKEAIKAEKVNKKEEKRLAQEKKKALKIQNKQKAREEEERIKRETKLALERKREAERAEIERIKAEVKANEERKKEEKLKQEEIKKALVLEKKVLKEEKRKTQPIEYKTIAQERKESLKREIRERRNIESHEDEKDVIIYNREDKIAVTLMDEKPAAEKEKGVKAAVNNPEKLHTEKAFVEKANVELAHVEKPKVEKGQIIKTGTAKEEKVKPAVKKAKQAVSLDDKLIEDILKEFLA